MSKIKQLLPENVFPIEDVRSGKVVIASGRNSGLFERIRKEVEKLVPEGTAKLVSDVIKLVPELKALKGAMRYNYLKGAIAKHPTLVYMNAQGRRWIGNEKPTVKVD